MTKNEYRRLKKAAKIAVAIAMKEAVRRINELVRNLNNVFRLVRKMKIESTDAVEGRGMHFTLMRRIEQNSGKHICQK